MLTTGLTYFLAHTSLTILLKVTLSRPVNTARLDGATIVKKAVVLLGELPVREEMAVHVQQGLNRLALGADNQKLAGVRLRGNCGTLTHHRPVE